jgi:hypothetical protein
MALELALALTLAGFLVLFWLTPLGVPTLRRLAGGEMSPDLQFGYRPDDAYRLIERYGSRGRAHWRRLLLLDMIFPAVYAALFALLLLRWADWVHAGPAWRAAAAAPLLAGASDYAENVLLLKVLRALPRRIPETLVAASLFTRAKFIFSWLTLMIPLAFWSWTVVSRFY